MKERSEAEPQNTEAAAHGSVPSVQVNGDRLVVRPVAGPVSSGPEAGLMTRFRKVCRFLHRELGYLFFGATIAYCVSGLALNHLRDWNPNYSITRRESTLTVPAPDQPFKKDTAQDVLKQAGVRYKYLSHYSPAAGQTRIFFENGNATVDRASGNTVVEMTTRRPLLFTFNKLHYNPGRWWTWYADVFSAALLVVAVTGLFLLRGRQGITRRGGVLVIIGILIPTVLVLLYF
jgi:uncharacterized protein